MIVVSATIQFKRPAADEHWEGLHLTNPSSLTHLEPRAGTSLKLTRSAAWHFEMIELILSTVNTSMMKARCWNDIWPFGSFGISERCPCFPQEKQAGEPGPVPRSDGTRLRIGVDGGSGTILGAVPFSSVVGETTGAGDGSATGSGALATASVFPFATPSTTAPPPPLLPPPAGADPPPSSLVLAAAASASRASLSTRSKATASTVNTAAASPPPPFCPPSAASSRGCPRSSRESSRSRSLSVGPLKRSPRALQASMRSVFDTTLPVFTIHQSTSPAHSHPVGLLSASLYRFNLALLLERPLFALSNATASSPWHETTRFSTTVLVLKTLSSVATKSAAVILLLSRTIEVGEGSRH
mmetsp:Transcript_20432/g.49236  ORF Transcript_20432/g.49236 Transcript_20432/m.49236 type:complete len:356 (-) Transcript_20432:960-2027(-)